MPSSTTAGTAACSRKHSCEFDPGDPATHQEVDPKAFPRPLSRSYSVCASRFTFHIWLWTYCQEPLTQSTACCTQTASRVATTGTLALESIFADDMQALCPTLDAVDSCYGRLAASRAVCASLCQENAPAFLRRDILSRIGTI